MKMKCYPAVLLTCVTLFAPLVHAEPEADYEADYEEEAEVEAEDTAVPDAVRASMRASQKERIEEACSLFGQLLSVAEGITDRASADAAAPKVRELNAALNECLERVFPFMAEKADMAKLDALMAQVALASGRLREARLFGSVALAEASGFSAAAAREHEELTLQAKAHIGKLLLARHAELAARYPGITGGPGWGEENAWVVEDSTVETQEALVEEIISGIGSEADFAGAYYLRKGERSYAVLRISLLIEGKYFFLPMYVDITGEQEE